MKILLYHWPSFFEDDLKDILQEEGVSFDCLTWKFENKNHDDKFLDFIHKNISLKQYDLLFSINYWPLLSEICQKAGIPYVSWCYDNPLNVRNIQKTLGNDVNRVYCFDRIQALDYQQQGFQNVCHLPLGINAKRLSKVHPSDHRCDPFQTQVSFVGKLYESATDWLMSGAGDYCQGYLQALLNAQQEIYGAFILDQSIDDSFMKKINADYQKSAPGTSFVLKKEELTFALACEVTKRDRILLLSLLGSRFKTKFYSYNDSAVIKGAEKCPPVDYRTEMPYVFAASAINLNPCLRAIQSGIPLRALDIMACGGFLLSSYQEELAESFIHGEETVMYESLGDAVEKAGYYLTHEALREQIATNGRRKTLQDYDMRDRLKCMLQN